MAITKLPTNYTSDVINESIKKRKYKITTNSDGTAYLDDVTNYSKKGSNFDAEDINKINNTINQLIDKAEQQEMGSSGSDSFSSTATVTKQGNVATITVTDKNGTTTAAISDGEKGEKGDTGAAGPKGDKGEKGDKGDQGFSPTITENSGNNESVYKLDITTKEGTITTPNLKGADGKGGIDGSEEVNAKVLIPWESTSNGTYAFIKEGTKWTSNNQGKASSTATTTWTIDIPQVVEYSLRYKVSSEDKYDKFTLTLDGTTIANEIAGNGDELTYSVTLAEGSHTIVATYSKDNSQDKNSDCAYVVLEDVEIVKQTTVSAIVPTIGETGNWVIEGTDTGKPSRGENGLDGQAATISVGTVTTGEPGTQASVTNSGTSNAAVFDFVIPKGEKGDVDVSEGGVSLETLILKQTGGVKFGKDADGNPGYYKYDESAGADTLVPFSSGGMSNSGIDMNGLNAAIVSLEYHSYEGYEQVTV